MGAKVGTHKVTISKREYAETSHDEAAGTGSEPVKKPKKSAHGEATSGGPALDDGGVETINSEFNSASGLTETVKAGTDNVFDFDVRGV